MGQLGTFLDTMPTPVLVALGLILIAEWALIIYALVKLVRTPAERITLGGRKWLWALIIVVLNSVALGAILFLVMGRKPEAAVAPAPNMPAGDRAAAAADALYGAAPAAAQDAGAIDGGGEQL